MAMIYDWVEFSLSDALAGTLVGFPQTNKYDLTYTGVLKGPGPIYKLAIGGYNLKVDQNGVVKEVTPSTTVSSSWVNQTLSLVRTSMGSDGAVGSSVTRSSGSSGTGHSATAVLSTMEPRDHFAMNVLNAMLVHMEMPESKDDATMIKYCRAAYLWAQAMMIAAADSREGTSESTAPSTTVDIKSDDLQSNMEKILYNMAEYMKKGVAIKGETVAQGQTAVPIITKLDPNSEIKEVKKVTDIPGLTSINSTLGTTNTRLSSIYSELDYIETDMENINTSIQDITKVPDVGSITIKASIFQSKYLRFEFNSDMAYSDVSVILELSVSEGSTTATRKVGYVIPKGSVVVIEELDAEVTSISSITSASVRGQGVNDTNTYTISTT